MGLSHPLSGKTDKELSDYLTYYLDCRIFHLKMAEYSPAGSETRRLHEFRAKFCTLRARELETILKERKQAQAAQILELARIGIGLSVCVN